MKRAAVLAVLGGLAAAATLAALGSGAEEPARSPDATDRRSEAAEPRSAQEPAIRCIRFRLVDEPRGSLRERFPLLVLMDTARVGDAGSGADSAYRALTVTGSKRIRYPVGWWRRRTSTAYRFGSPSVYAPFRIDVAGGDEGELEGIAVSTSDAAVRGESLRDSASVAASFVECPATDG